MLIREARGEQMLDEALHVVGGLLAPTEVVMEACAGSHHWGRVLAGLGHRVRLIPAQYVKPFVKRGKKDRNDAEAICEADKRLMAQLKADADGRRLAAIPGVGPMIALGFALRVEATQFASGRHFAAWLGLVPRENSTGGKRRLGGISRAGNERLRQLLVLGATSVIRYAKPGRPGVSAWLLALLERKPRKLAAVALANKMARVIWAMLTSGEAYRRPTPVAA